MAHELSGHALTCAVAGTEPANLAPATSSAVAIPGWARRLVAMAGAGMDVLPAQASDLAAGWTALAAVVSWTVITVKGMVAAGYWVFSGVTNRGDWARPQ